MKFFRSLRTPFALLAVAVAFYGAAFWLLNQHVWTPLDIPFPLNAGTFRTPSFAVDLNAIYRVEVEIDRLLPLEKLEPMLGIRSGGSDPPASLDLVWAVFDQQGAKQTPPYSYTSGVGSTSTTISRLLGDFRGRKGQSYSIQLDLKTDAHALKNFRPRLVVSEASHVFKGNLAIAQILALPGWGFGLVALVWLVILALRAVFVQVIKRSASSA